MAYGNSGTDRRVGRRYPDHAEGRPRGRAAGLREGDCARQLPRQFPGTTFAFLPADIVTQILNFGLPAPIDVQVIGPNIEANRAYADKLLAQHRAGAGHRRPAHPAGLQRADA